MNSKPVSLALAAMLFALLGCSSDDERVSTPTEPRLSTLSGTVDFQRVGELKVDDVIVIELVDVTDGEEDAPVLASAQIGDSANSPYAFKLTYDPKLIEEGRQYRVRSEIRRRDETVNDSAQSLDPFVGTSTVVQAIHALRGLNARIFLHLARASSAGAVQSDTKATG